MGFSKHYVGQYLKSRAGLWLPHDLAGAGVDYASLLYDVWSNYTPVSLLVADMGYETLDGSGDVSAATCAWGSGHNASEATQRPHKTSAGWWEFDASAVDSGERLVWDFTSGVSADDHVLIARVNIASLSWQSHLFSSKTGRLDGCTRTSSGNTGIHDGAFQDCGTPLNLGDQVVSWVFRGGTGTASVRSDGAQVGNLINCASRAIGGTTKIGVNYGDYGYCDILLKGILIATGAYDLAEVAAAEAIMAKL